MAVTKKATKAKKTEVKDGAKITWRAEGDGNLLAMFNATFSGITIYGCKLFVTKDGEKNFVSMPERRGSDGKYYKEVYVNEDISTMLTDWACKAYETDNGLYEHASLVPAK